MERAKKFFPEQNSINHLDRDAFVKDAVGPCNVVIAKLGSDYTYLHTDSGEKKTCFEFIREMMAKGAEVRSLGNNTRIEGNIGEIFEKGHKLTKPPGRH